MVNRLPEKAVRSFRISEIRRDHYEKDRGDHKTV